MDDVPPEGGEAEWKTLEGGEGKLNIKVSFTKDVGAATDGNGPLLTVDEDAALETDEEIAAGFKEVNSFSCVHDDISSSFLHY